VTKGGNGVTRPRADAEAGFTLVELLVAFAIAALVLAAATAAFQSASRVLEFGLDTAAAQDTARWGLERMTREIRGAGYGHPTCPPPPPGTSLIHCFDAVSNPTATSITLQNDFNGNNALDAPPPPPPGEACDHTAVTEQVRYQFDAPSGELRRSTDPNNPDPNNRACDAVVADGIVNNPIDEPLFTYLDANGDPTATPSNIRSVVVTLRVASNNGGTEQRVVMRDQVRIRNR
jgi:prepilin-type N-terminal cleavage/methylation domain-containing protein